MDTWKRSFPEMIASWRDRKGRMPEEETKRILKGFKESTATCESCGDVLESPSQTWERKVCKCGKTYLFRMPESPVQPAMVVDQEYIRVAFIELMRAYGTKDTWNHRPGGFFEPPTVGYYSYACSRDGKGKRFDAMLLNLMLSYRYLSKDERDAVATVAELRIKSLRATTDRTRFLREQLESHLRVHYIATRSWPAI